MSKFDIEALPPFAVCSQEGFPDSDAGPWLILNATFDPEDKSSHPFNVSLVGLGSASRHGGVHVERYNAAGEHLLFSGYNLKYLRQATEDEIPLPLRCKIDDKCGIITTRTNLLNFVFVHDDPAFGNVSFDGQDIFKKAKCVREPCRADWFSYPLPFIVRFSGSSEDFLVTSISESKKHIFNLSGISARGLSSVISVDRYGIFQNKVSFITSITPVSPAVLSARLLQNTDNSNKKVAPMPDKVSCLDVNTVVLLRSGLVRKCVNFQAEVGSSNTVITLRPLQNKHVFGDLNYEYSCDLKSKSSSDFDIVTKLDTEKKIRMGLSVSTRSVVLINGNPALLTSVKETEARGTYRWEVTLASIGHVQQFDPAKTYHYSVTGKEKDSGLMTIEGVFEVLNEVSLLDATEKTAHCLRPVPRPQSEKPTEPSLEVKINGTQGIVSLVKGSKLLKNGILFVVRGFVDNLIVVDEMDHYQHIIEPRVLDSENLESDDMLYVSDDESLFSCPSGYCVRYSEIPEDCALVTNSSVRADFEIVYENQLKKVVL